MALFEVLLVEDSGADVFLMQEAFEAVTPRARLHVSGDGVDALDFLRRPGAGQPRPDLILLDLNLHCMGGLEMLRELRADPGLCAPSRRWTAPSAG